VRLALVSGDGLPVSGLLSVFRNVVQLGTDLGLLELPIPADLGYSWRPDKPGFYPSGEKADAYPDWLDVSRATPAGGAELAAEWLSLRREIAVAGQASPGTRAELGRRCAALAGPYERYFTEWFEAYDVQWVCALNMTISDAVPVTMALHRAARRRWGAGRPGGVLFWDHDLFGSYAVHENGSRVYPPFPHALTPLPGTGPAQWWAVVSPQLAGEVHGYPTPGTPELLPNPLPVIRPGPLSARQQSFLTAHRIDVGRPVLLAPVRVFHVKGVEIAIRLLAELRRRRAPGEEAPCLLVFGSLHEDPDYAARVIAAARECGVPEDVRFLDGVPLTTYQDERGGWRLDEVDLLHLAATTHGGVLFTPSRPDVESVGLGPALAAVSGVPVAVTGFNAFDDVYGDAFRCVRIGAGPEALPRAAADLDDWLRGLHRGDPGVRAALDANHELVRQRFPDEPWRQRLRAMADAVGEGTGRTDAAGEDAAGEGTGRCRPRPAPAHRPAAVAAAHPGWLPGPADLARYEDDGFLMVRGLLTGAEVARFRAAARHYADLRRHESRDLEGWEKIFLQEQFVWKRDGVLAGLSLHPGLAAVAAALIQAPVRVFLDQVICKYPGDDPTRPHQDAPFLAYDDRRSVNAWVALGPVTPAHGALSYYQGSQRLGLLREVDLGLDDDLLRDAPELRDLTLLQAAAEPGDVVLHHCLVVHEAGPNRSGEDRLAYSVQYMPAGARYNGREHEFFATAGLRVGDPLSSPGYFPVPGTGPC
jgi:ectoine hydroxylase-related dioxygenase (phytanoyl-CoA dioxygenase family)/glycosyltransferase involved in cell wall biosynthesis